MAARPCDRSPANPARTRTFARKPRESCHASRGESHARARAQVTPVGLASSSAGTGADRFLWRWSGPERQASSEAVREHTCAEVALVLPLDLGHGEQAVDPLRSPRVTREARGGLVLADVPALEASSAVHRRKPAAEVTEHGENAADHPGAELARAARARAELGQ